jgi:hypothetical protein
VSLDALSYRFRAGQDAPICRTIMAMTEEKKKVSGSLSSQAHS